jgi:hypothetical protein
LLTADGTYYIGEFRNDKMHGKGRITHPSGAYYDGDWFEGNMHGKGILIFILDFYRN